MATTIATSGDREAGESRRAASASCRRRPRPAPGAAADAATITAAVRRAPRGQDFPHPGELEVTVEDEKRGAPGRRSAPASAARPPLERLDGERRGQDDGGDAKMPRLTLVSTARRAARRTRRRSSDPPGQAEGREQRESAASSITQRPCGCIGSLARTTSVPEGGDHSGQPEEEAAGQPLRREAEQQARPHPDDDHDRAAGVGGDRVPSEREQTAEQLVVERPVDRPDVAVERRPCANALNRPAACPRRRRKRTR